MSQSLASHCFLGVIVLLASEIGFSARQSETSPVKIFVLAGQSNMQGQGEILPASTKGTLRHVVENDPNGDYPFLVNETGNWAVRDDVWVCYQRNSTQFIAGSLTPGYGASDATIGPELGFGHVIGDYLDNQVLIVKTAWGGKSLAVDFRPPSSGGAVGLYYNEILRLVADAVANLKNYFPGYDDYQGYEIAGFGWHQGWNDAVSETSSLEYEQNLANFIRDIRNDLGVKNLPFVIANSGFGGFNKVTDGALVRCQNYLQPAQAAVATYPEFQGNVLTVDTRAFWRSVEESPADQGYHWNRNGESYLRIGLSMGQAMKTLVQPHSILREWWTGINGASVSDLVQSPGYPGLPHGTEELTSLKKQSDWADAYGARIRGYLYPPATGDYTFWIASDDDSALWLSLSLNTDRAVLIASVSGRTDPCSWDESPSQQSSPILLTAGRPCYIEALHKEDYGADHLAVAWEGPDLPRTIIDGQYLSPWTGAGPPALTVENLKPESVGMKNVTLNGQVISTSGDHPTVFIYWGARDSGMTQSGWDHVENLGTQSATFSANITGLDPGATHYFRCYAVGTNGYDWADSAAQFKTLPASPIIENTDASNIRGTTATLNGQVIHPGEETPVVIVYWGDNDGKTVASDWDHSEDLGPQSGIFSVDISGLEQGVLVAPVYYFRCYASNSFGSSWASSTLTFIPRRGRY